MELIKKKQRDVHMKKSAYTLGIVLWFWVDCKEEQKKLAQMFNSEEWKKKDTNASDSESILSSNLNGCAHKRWKFACYPASDEKQRIHFVCNRNFPAPPLLNAKKKNEHNFKELKKNEHSPKLFGAIVFIFQFMTFYCILYQQFTTAWIHSALK